MLLYCDNVSSMTDEQFDLFFAMMPPERQEKTMRYVRAEDRRQSVAAFALLGFALHLNGYKIGEYELAVADNGKPYFKNLLLHFSLSHTAGAVACTVSQSETGVDVQRKREDYRRVIRRVCCENEIELISSSQNPTDTFTALWSLKESYVKCIGTSVFDSVSDYDFSSVAGLGSGELYGYHFSVLDIGESMLASCSSSPETEPKSVSIGQLEAFCQNI
ncbi:MAG: 4'-phosphopantetheinyl transferase superfamily protein [Clostridia bacterium]|nr:4'-phosphopantetheinyl transferase superfamily protein [Clostridia bacterium]